MKREKKKNAGQETSTRNYPLKYVMRNNKGALNFHSA